MHSVSIREALVTLNQMTSDTQTLLVVNEEQKLVGTLTDGDIRRGLIFGAELSDTVNTIMHQDFKYVLESEYDVAHLKKFRDMHIFFIPILDEAHRIADIINLKRYKSNLPIDAVLMAGGKGERLRPLTEKTPKPLVKVGEKCIIDYNIDNLLEYGVKHLNVTVNYLGEQLEEHFAKPRNGVQVRTFREPKFLGTIGSIKFVERFHNKTILVMNSDLFTNINYEDFYLHFVENNADMSVAVVPYTISVPYGIFELDGRNIKGILEKPTYNYYVNAGIYLIKSSMLDLIKEGDFCDATDFMKMLICKDYKVIRFPLNGTWIDIGNPQEYQKAKEIARHLK